MGNTNSGKKGDQIENGKTSSSVFDSLVDQLMLVFRERTNEDAVVTIELHSVFFSLVVSFFFSRDV